LNRTENPPGPSVIPTVDPMAWQDLVHVFNPVEETCAFMIGNVDEAGPVVLEFWPTINTWEERPGKRQKDQGYAIPSKEWNRAKAAARRAGLQVLGHAHTHPGSTAAPSFWDFRTVKRGELGGVWHLRSGRLTLFDRSRALLRSYAIALPPLLRAYAECAGAAEAVDLAKLPRAEPITAPPVPINVIEAARQVVRTLRDPRALRRAMVAAGISDLRQTSITAERVVALEAALSAYGLQ
jgi:proteasome lid subunit RPN8/RPN11